MNNPDNLIHEYQTDVRTELWKDHIYYISFNPYRFPTHDGKSTGFLPLPQRFQEIITEFKEEFAKQKEAEKAPEKALQAILAIKEEISTDILTEILAREQLEKETSELGKAVEELLELINHPNTPLNKSYQEINKFVQQWKEETKSSTTSTSENSTIRNGKDWKKISSQFTPELIDEWISRGFDYQQTKEWIDISDSSNHDQIIKDYEFIGWLVNKKKGNHANPDWWANHSSDGELEKLRQQYDKLKGEKKVIPELADIETRLQEWEGLKKLAASRVNACHIYDDEQSHIRFVYQPPRGNFVDLPKFLWYRNNVFYETLNWKKINHENAEIQAIRSTFIHTYIAKDGLVMNGGNGVLTYHPKFGNKDEVCKCPSILSSTEMVELISNWQPSYSLFRASKWVGGGLFWFFLMNKPYGQDKSVKAFHTIDLEKNDQYTQYDFLTESTYFLLPDWYEKGTMTGRKKTGEGGIPKLDFVTAASRKTLKEWLDVYQMNRGQEHEHLLKEINVNFLWNSKIIANSILDDFDFDNIGLEIRANPAEIMYRFISGKVLWRYSEDLSFTVPANKIATIGTQIADRFVGINIDEASRNYNYLHDFKRKEKSGEEIRSWERKSKMTTSVDTTKAAIGVIPTLIDASHTKGNYTLPEFALRFDSINLKMRIEFNKNNVNHYQMMKKLKRSGHEVFNAPKIGNRLAKGFIQMENVTFEGDSDGYYANLLQIGQYFYEKDPHEFFLQPLEKLSFKRELANSDLVGANTTIQNNYTSAIGRDNLVHVDDMSWVWKDSYCRPQGGGTDLFPQLINGMRHNIKKDDAKAWKFDGYKKDESSTTLKKDVHYEWFMHAFSGEGQKDNRNFRGVDDGVTVILRQDGADWELAFIGRVEITNMVGDPGTIGGGIEINSPDETLIDMEDPNQTEKLNEFAKTMEQEAHVAKEKTEEEELNPEDTKDKKKTKEQEEVKEEESDASKTKAKDKTKDKSKQTSKDKTEEKSDNKEGEK